MSDDRHPGAPGFCRVCSADALREFDAYRALPRVTSDCKPFRFGGRIAACTACGAVQKIADNRWLQEIDEIYRDFEIYHQSGGTEQPIFDLNGCAMPRSRRLIAGLGSVLSKQREGKLLDFGCGNGAMLASFSAEWPGWDLYGSELSDNALATLQSIPRFKELFVCPIDRIPGRFDLVTLIHSLEHLLEPVEMLRQLGGLMQSSGRAFVQVPDAAQNPYDFLVADHLMHFTSDILRLVSQLAGYGTHLLSDRVLVKELSWVGSPEKNPSPARDAIRHSTLGTAMVERNLSWLAAQLSRAREIARNSRRFGIFGSSNSSTWLAGALMKDVAFFVDEDLSRVGRTHLERPIIHPTQVDERADVFVPLIPNVAKRVAKRYGSEYGRYHTPPDLDAST